MWQVAIPAAINLAGGLFASRSAKKAAEQQRQAREAQAGTYEQQGQNVQGAYNEYGQNMFGLADQATERFQFNPISARGPFGGVQMQGNQLVNQLDPTGQSLQAGAGNVLNEAMMFDRGGAQDAYYQNLQSMYAPTRQLQTESLLRKLQSKGMAGLGSNVNGNMLTKGMASGWNEQDLAAAKMAMDYGGSELDRLYQRGYGMLNAVQGMSNANLNQWNVGQGMAQPFQMGGNEAWLGLMQKGYGAPLQGTISAADFMTNAANIRAGGQINYAAARDAANQGMISGIVKAGNSMPWGSMFSGVGSNMPTNMFSANSGNVDAMLRAGMGVGPW